MSDEQLTTEDMQVLEDALKSYGGAAPEEKQNIHAFLNKVATSTDTTKTGYLKDEELGHTAYALRTYKKMALDAESICKDKAWAEYFQKKGEILTATSLSRDAKLLSLAVLRKTELADVTTQPRKENKGWFTKKDNPSSGAS